MEHVKVILLQKVARLGHIGDVVNVKPGFARNYLLPKKIALRATNENLKYFEDKKVQIEAANAESKGEALKLGEKMQNLKVTVIRQASDKGHLYGSVTCRDIAAAVKVCGFTVTAGQVNLNTPIKTLGVYDLCLDLHPEVSIPIKLSVAKSEEEALLQVKEPSTAVEKETPTEKSVA
jgi:large subunit ribosomal protein L9